MKRWLMGLFILLLAVPAIALADTSTVILGLTTRTFTTGWRRSQQGIRQRCQRSGNDRFTARHHRLHQRKHDCGNAQSRQCRILAVCVRQLSEIGSAQHAAR